MARYTLFISDLHLEASAPERTASFFSFLDEQACFADALYILGDFFDLWIGDDEHQAFHSDVISKLKEYSSMIPIYFMHGNHDFLVGQQFTQESGINLINDPSIIELYGNKIILAHGDGLMTDDLQHMRFRRLYQNKFIRKLFLSFPLSLRKSIANFAKKKSRSHLKKDKTLSFDINPNAVKALLKKNTAQYLIHGHMHKPNIYHINFYNKNSTRVVLDSWHRFGNYLLWKDNGEKSLQWFCHQQPQAAPLRRCCHEATEGEFIISL